MFLANEVLGYHFQPNVHTELFSNYLTIKFNDKGEPEPLLFQSEFKDRMVLWSRGHFKTTSIVVEAIQLILNFPDIRIVLMRSTLESTQEWLGEILAHFTGEAQNSRLHDLFPEFCGTRKELKASGLKFTTTARTRKQLREATVTVASATSNTTGKHWEVGMFDDLITPQNCTNKKMVEKVAKAFYQYVPLIEPGGYKYVTGTRYTFGDLYEKIIMKNVNKNWIVSIKDCWTDDKKGVRFPQVMVPGKSEPIGFTRELLQQIMLDDPQMFSCQYLNHPTRGSTELFTEQMLVESLVDRTSPTFPQLYQATFFIDTAASKKTGRDHTVIICGQRDDFQNTYVTDVRGDNWSPDETALNVIHMALIHRPSRILIEGTAAGKWAVEYIRMMGRNQNPPVNLPLETITPSNQSEAKELRIRALKGEIVSKRLRFCFGLPRWDLIKKEFVEFPESQHDDYPDTIALMVQHFQKTSPPPPRPFRHPMFNMNDRTNDITRTIFEAPNLEESTCGDDFAS
jgi:hypothetical protein